MQRMRGSLTCHHLEQSTERLTAKREKIASERRIECHSYNTSIYDLGSVPPCRPVIVASLTPSKVTVLCIAWLRTHKSFPKSHLKPSSLYPHASWPSSLLLRRRPAAGSSSVVGLAPAVGAAAKDATPLSLTALFCVLEGVTSASTPPRPRRGKPCSVNVVDLVRSRLPVGRAAVIESRKMICAD